ncbi:DUF309 domain-containing protein [Candidatus Frankia alpina]|uniref:DUF309 domain-containing protein n=1 Tax=Candidatus Frankia alpina TaxID=2699483 RepID=A0A4S5ERS9_9ACTN|nr:DUF309 domain-containing protein [Candidatus Frankia alpina]THJ75056.1 DUF309 domain-containing protein [Candidatus Frankia alpina]
MTTSRDPGHPDGGELVRHRPGRGDHPDPVAETAERPRDALGRFLPPGVAGVPPLELPTSLPPRAALAAAQHLLDTGHPFQAHEVLEAAWKSADDVERNLWRGLTQLAVGVTHLARGNVRGGVAVLGRASDNLAPYAEYPPHDVDVAGLRGWIADRVAADRVAAGTPVGRPPRLLR